MQYKCVRGDSSLTISNSNEVDFAISRIADIINREAKDGWEFDSMFPINVTKIAASGGLRGRFASLGDDMADGDYTYNVYVFKKH